MTQERIDRETTVAETGLTAGLARLAAQPPAVPPGHPALAAATRAFIDTVGVTLAGWREPSVALLVDSLATGRDATALLGGRQFSARDAALLNGMVGHVLDYDDVAVHGHPSVVLVPAILAEAQKLGRSGGDALRAYVVGYEAWAELGWRESGSYHLGAWHPTAMLGTVAATVAVAALNRLDAETATNAIAMAASFAGGLIANFGSPTKPLQAGRAAASAIEAAQLARTGLTGSPTALESPHGFLRAISPDGAVDTDGPLRLAARADDLRLLHEGLSVKRYPVCYASHRAIDGVIDLASQAQLRPADVVRVTASLGRAPAATLRFDRPATGIEARFSLHHNVAAALTDRAVGFAQLSDDYVRRPEIAALYTLTETELVDDECPEQPGLARFDRVVIETRDGGRLDSGPIRYPRGHARLPLSDADLDAKFLDCARHGGLAEAAGLLERLRGLETLADLSELCA
ncbi:MmgE/PrpD family protein [Novosphingobium sp. JCM 18896]|uniref:MmgE/PrpD family protein n=1 Tax=Novosphingobium sp. JCM 18896 TaxID=2989731 RepID=UPI002223460D|nr:MmgE/PrpD family protein [Novosphingobium sp. JCM 18896]MCW1427540.1 MmgE/PrpD family protein [Novosphingobium sp. JCM 18896]